MKSGSDLTFITDRLPGIGGELKVEPSLFVVEEIPLYEPCGEGEHLYVNITREGITTRDVKLGLMSVFNLSDEKVSYAGMKDKHARTTQTFSLHIHKMEAEEAEKIITDNMSVKVNWVDRHKNKLRMGHLVGNKFDITVLNVVDDAETKSEKIIEELDKNGLPNYYGEQRFGLDDNASKGKKILFGGRQNKKWLRKLLLSAYTSYLFNMWLSDRIETQKFNCLLEGDIAKKTETGGLFLVDDIDTDQVRFQDREIVYTGPIFGSKMKSPSGEPAKVEQSILDGEEISLEMFKRVRADGTRRAGKIYLDDLKSYRVKNGMRFVFSLPKGSYATVVMREFIKDDGVA